MWIKEYTGRNIVGRQNIDRRRLTERVLEILGGTDHFGLVFKDGKVFYQNSENECNHLSGPNSAPSDFRGLIFCFIYKVNSIPLDVILKAENALKTGNIAGNDFSDRCKTIDEALNPQGIEFAVIFVNIDLLISNGENNESDLFISNGKNNESNRKNISPLINNLKANDWDASKLNKEKWNANGCTVLYHRQSMENKI